MNRIVLNALRLLGLVIRKDKHLVCFLFNGYSGSNLSPIIDYYKSTKCKAYRIRVVRVDQQLNSSKGLTGVLLALQQKIIICKYALRSQLLLSTHGFYRLRHDNFTINLWHGIPMKSMALMNRSNSDEIGSIDDDIIISTSEFYITVLNACLGLRAQQYQITGYPRNDYLFKENGLRNLEKITGIKTQQKIILFMPTYEDNIDGYRMDEINDLFGFAEFDLDAFRDYLQSNDIFFIIKLHPNDEKRFAHKFAGIASNSICLLMDQTLEKHEMDLYRILNCADLLITDYSSVYFDYLLLDRPVVFVPSDILEYRRARGLLLEPYDFWAAGPKCFDQSSLQDEITRSLEDHRYYADRRRIIRDIMHKYQDGESTARVIEIIDELMHQ